MGRVIHFEIQADDQARAKQFYETVFGWHVEQWDGPSDYWLVITGTSKSKLKGKENDGIDGAIIKRRGQMPTYDNPISAFVNIIDVDNIDTSSQAVIANGGNVIVTKQAVPKVGWMAYAKDTEGNTFGIMQADPQAE